MKPTEIIIQYLDRTFKEQIIRGYKIENSLLIQEFDENFGVLVKVIERQFAYMNKTLIQMRNLIEELK